MKSIFRICFLLIVLAFTRQVSAVSINEVTDSLSDVSVEIRNNSGNILVQGWENNQVKISASAEEGFELKRALDNIFFNANSSDISKKLHDVEVFVPFQSDVNISAVDANVRISEVYGDVRVHTINGKINASQVSKNIHLQTVNGDVTLSDASGFMSLETINGSINAKSTHGEMNVSSVGGDVTIDSTLSNLNASNVSGSIDATLNKVKSLKMNTVEGTVDVSAVLRESANVSVESVKGDIEFQVPQETSAKFRVNTFEGKEILNDITDHEVISVPDGSGKELRFNLNSGESLVQIASLSGSVTLGLASTPAMAKMDLEEFDAGLDMSFFDVGYVRPGFNLSQYKKVYIKDPTVEFSERWLKKFDTTQYVSYSNRIKKDYGAMLKEVLAKRLVKEADIEIVDQRGDDVLVLLPSLQNVFITNPETAGIKHTLFVYVGYAALELTVYSDKDQEVLAMFIDQRDSKKLGSQDHAVALRAKNERSFRSLFKKWAKQAVKHLQEN